MEEKEHTIGTADTKPSIQPTIGGHSADAESVGSLEPTPTETQISVQHFLSLPQLHELTGEERTMLDTVIRWAESSAGDDRLGILQEIRTLESKLGAPQIGDTRLNTLYRWVRLDLEQQRLDEEKRLYER